MGKEWVDGFDHLGDKVHRTWGEWIWGLKRREMARPVAGVTGEMVGLPPVGSAVLGGCGGGGLRVGSPCCGAAQRPEEGPGLRGPASFSRAGTPSVLFGVGSCSLACHCTGRKTVCWWLETGQVGLEEGRPQGQLSVSQAHHQYTALLRPHMDLAGAPP